MSRPVNCSCSKENTQPHLAAGSPSAFYPKLYNASPIPVLNCHFFPFKKWQLRPFLSRFCHLIYCIYYIR